MIKKFIQYILMGCILTPSMVWGQNVSIQGKLDRSEIKTGEQAAIDLVIRTNNLAKTKFYLKENPTAGEPYTVIEFGALDTVDVDASLKEITARLIVTSFDSTLVTIPPIVVETPEGKAETQPMALNVVQPEVDAAHPESFKDIKSPWEVTLGLKDWLELILRSWIFWLVVGLLLIAYVIYRVILHRRNRPIREPEVIEVRLSVAELALQRLQELEAGEIWKQGLYKEYYTGLVDILKTYLDDSFAWTTSEMTTSELRDFVRERKLAREQIGHIEELLQEADLSKFAKGTPSAEAAVASLGKVRLLIQYFESIKQEQTARSTSITIAEKEEKV